MLLSLGRFCNRDRYKSWNFRDMAQPTNRPFKPDPQRLYCALYKPFAVLSQFTQADDSPKRTLAEFGFPAKLYPVGRLDWDSEGLLILSDDARLTSALL